MLQLDLPVCTWMPIVVALDNSDVVQAISLTMSGCDTWQVVTYEGRAAVPLNAILGGFRKLFFLQPRTFEMYGRVQVGSFLLAAPASRAWKPHLCDFTDCINASFQVAVPFYQGGIFVLRFARGHWANCCIRCTTSAPSEPPLFLVGVPQCDSKSTRDSERIRLRPVQRIL